MNTPAEMDLDREAIEKALMSLAKRLSARGVTADLFVVGGAAMALAYDTQRVTRDVDALFVPHGIVHEEALKVAEELGLPRWWLNEQASVYVSTEDDVGKRQVFDQPGLRVAVASPRHIFAMKARAARGRDISDLRLLAGLAKIGSLDEAVEITRAFFPDEGLPDWSLKTLRDLFEEPAK